MATAITIIAVWLFIIGCPSNGYDAVLLLIVLLTRTAVLPDANPPSWKMPAPRSEVVPEMGKIKLNVMADDTNILNRFDHLSNRFGADAW